MDEPKHHVIFSHGFGVKKDSRGLFTEIAESLNGIDSILFDYNEIDEVARTITVLPLSKQVALLNKVIEEAKRNYPNDILDLICHSQGCLVAALVKPMGIRKAIMLGASLTSNIDHAVSAFKSRPGTEIHFDKVSKLARKDGSTTLVPVEYWPERRSVDPIKEYNEYSKLTEIVMVMADQDEVLGSEDSAGLSPIIQQLHLDGDHNFSGESRTELIQLVKRLVLS